MNPAKANKVDINSMTEEEQKLFRLYGKLPQRKDLLNNKLKERKYFDSGDYALSQAGKASGAGITQVGKEIPSPESIPHNVGTSASPMPPSGQGSPVKESSILRGETIPSESAASKNVEKELFSMSDK